MTKSSVSHTNPPLDDGQSDAQPSLLFSKLPAELRLLIWEFTMASSAPIPFFSEETLPTEEDASGSPMHQRRLCNTIPPLLATNRSIRRESLRIYYSQNTFLIQPSLSFRSKDANLALLQKIEPHWKYFNTAAVECIPHPLVPIPTLIAYFTLIPAVATTPRSLNVYTDAVPGVERPMTRAQAYATDTCVCAQVAHGNKRLGASGQGSGEFLLKGVVDFGHLTGSHVYRVQDVCAECGKGMLHLRRVFGRGGVEQFEGD